MQLIVFVFSFFMLYNVYLYWRKGEMGVRGAFLWIVVWVGLLFITFFPKYIEPFVREMFFVRLFDLANVLALVVLAYVMFENHVRINRLQRQMGKLVSRLAIKKGIEHASKR